MALIAAAFIGAIGSTAAAGLSSGGGSDVTTRDPVDDFRRMLGALETTAGRRYALEAQSRPLYQGLDLAGIENVLYGIEGGPRTETYMKDVVHKAYDYYTGVGGQRQLHHQPETITQVPMQRRVNVPAQKGYLDILRRLQPELNQLTAQGTTAQRTAEMEDILNLGPKVREAYAATYPEQMGGLDKILGVTQDELALGGELSDRRKHDLRQQIRELQGDKGQGWGTSDAFEESVGLQLAGHDLYRQRLEDASKASALYSGATPDPFLALTRTPFQSGGQGAGLLQQGAGLSGAGGNVFNSWQGYMQNLSDYNANAQNAASISAANRQAGILGGVLGAGGQLGAAYMQRPVAPQQPKYGPGF